MVVSRLSPGQTGLSLPCLGGDEKQRDPKAKPCETGQNDKIIGSNEK